MSTETSGVTERLAAARTVVLRRVRRRRRTVNGLVAGAVLLVAGSGIGATFAVQQLSAREAALAVICYAHDDLGSLSGTSVMAEATDRQGHVLPADPLDKRAACELTWNSGIAVAAANGGHWPDVDPNRPGNFPIPPLAFCLLPNGETAGLPIEAPSTTAAQVCERLGLRVDPAM